MNQHNDTYKYTSSVIRQAMDVYANKKLMQTQKNDSWIVISALRSRSRRYYTIKQAQAQGYNFNNSKIMFHFLLFFLSNFSC